MYARGIGDLTSDVLNLPLIGPWTGTSVQDIQNQAALSVALTPTPPPAPGPLDQISAWISANPVPTLMGSVAIFLLAFVGGNARR